MEDVALREIKSKLKGISQIKVHRRHRQGRIHFCYGRSPKRLLELEAVEGVFALLGIFHGVTTGRPGLIRIAEEISSVDLAPAVVVHNILHGVPDSSGIAVNCTVGRGHRFSSSELHQILKTVLVATYDLSEEEQRGPYHLQVRVEGARAVVGFRLSERALTAGTPGSRSGTGDLLLATARAIGMLVQPERGHRWLDPLCRGGVVLGAFAESFMIKPTGLETRLDWAEISAGYLSRFDGASVGLWDGGSIPYADDSFDGLFSQLSKRFRTFNYRLQSEFHRVLNKHGRAIVVCDRDRNLESGHGLFKCVERRPLYIRGEALFLYQLRKSS